MRQNQRFTLYISSRAMAISDFWNLCCKIQEGFPISFLLPNQLFICRIPGVNQGELLRVVRRHYDRGSETIVEVTRSISLSPSLTSDYNKRGRDDNTEIEQKSDTEGSSTRISFCISPDISLSLSLVFGSFSIYLLPLSLSI